MSVSKLVKEATPAGKLVSLLLKMYGQINNKQDANRAYSQIYPVLQDLLMRGARFESYEIQQLVDFLGTLPAWGARRENFKKIYLRDIYTLQKLPRDPNNIPSGLWH